MVTNFVKPKYILGIVFSSILLSGCVQHTDYMEVEDLPLDKELLQEAQERKKNNPQPKEEHDTLPEYDESIVEYK